VLALQLASLIGKLFFESPEENLLVLASLERKVSSSLEVFWSDCFLEEAQRHHTALDIECYLADLRIRQLTWLVKLALLYWVADIQARFAIFFV